MTQDKLWFGCIADDFTGATDIASFLAGVGITTIMYNNIPVAIPDPMPQAIVIATKVRSIEPAEAVSNVLLAVRFLQQAGASQIYYKYCSTFDSSPRGNIGPVSDALMGMLHEPYTILCPALPVNGRTVQDGRLSVCGVPLHESPMRNHPITPMWDDRIAELMREQSKYPVFPYSLAEMERGEEHLHEFVQEKHAQYEHFYLVPDYYESAHGQLIAKLFGQLRLMTGGSGLAGPLGEQYLKELERTQAGGADPRIVEDSQYDSITSERAVILAGSCSAMTLRQIAYFKERHMSFCQIDPERYLCGQQTIEQLEQFMDEYADQDVLFYSSASADEMISAQRHGRERVSAMLEQLMSQLANAAVVKGRKRVIVAGGETSGAVTQGLGLSAYHVGESVAPGVPVMIPLERPDMRLVLKSGNFGQEDFFDRALRMTENDQELEQMFTEVLWVAHSLFDRGKTSGSSANISFRYGDTIYISASGTCFGRLTKEDFVEITLDGRMLGQKKPSKEYPMHLAFYQKSPELKAVIHTHGPYSELISCLPCKDENDAIMHYTPYLSMKAGTVTYVPYAKPGSEELFSLVRERIGNSDAMLLANHGGVAAGKSIMEAFYILEEMEDSARIMWELRDEKTIQEIS